jgi:hypothetical protein
MIARRVHVGAKSRDPRVQSPCGGGHLAGLIGQRVGGELEAEREGLAGPDIPDT